MLESIRKILILLLVGLVGPAFSVPFTFTYSGRLLDTTTGQPISGTRSIKITFWTAQTAGSQLAANAQTGVTNDTYSVSLTSGVFSQTINLSAANFHTVFPDSTTGTWVQVQDMTAGTTYPRQQFTTVPYALKVPVDGSTITYNSSGQLQLSSIGSASLPATISATTVTASSKMGIGTTSPSSMFEVLGSGPIASSALVSSSVTSSSQTVAIFSAADNNHARVSVSASGTGSPVLDLTKTNGSAASPTVVVSGDLLGQISMWGYDGSALQRAARLQVNASENWSATARGSHFTVNLNAPGSTTNSEVLRVTGYGTLAIGTTNPTKRRLHIDTTSTTTGIGDGLHLTNATKKLQIYNSVTTGQWNTLTQNDDQTIVYGDLAAGNPTSGGLVIGPHSDQSGEGVRIDHDGKMGIGVSSPAAKLDVAGEVKFGNTSSTCNATNEGQQRYNSTSKLMEFCNGTAWTAYGTVPTGEQLFTASGTFTVPTGVTTVRAEVWGGGGGGSCTTADGTAGGTSSFGTYISATGGGGGTTNNSTLYGTGGAGGTGSGGSANFTGSAGKGIITYSGEGGGAPFGGAGGTAGCWGCGTNAKGGIGVAPGGGGGGAYYGGNSYGAGGGGGGYAYKEITGLTPGTAITVTVGAAGAAGNTTCASGGGSGAVRVRW